MSTYTPTWRTTFVKEVDGIRIITRSAVEDGVRLWEEAHWENHKDAAGETYLRCIRTEYWTTQREQHHHTWEAALAAAMPPVENNLP